MAADQTQAAKHTRLFNDSGNQRTEQALGKLNLPLAQGWTVQEVIEAMKPFINKLAAKYASRSYQYDDAQQCGMIGALKGLKAENGSGQTLRHLIRYISSEIRIRGKQTGIVHTPLLRGGVRVETGLDDISNEHPFVTSNSRDKVITNYRGQMDVDRIRLANDAKHFMLKLVNMAGLTPRQIQILKVYYGLGVKQAGPTQIGDILDISKTAVVSSIRASLKKLWNTVGWADDPDLYDQFEAIQDELGLAELGEMEHADYQYNDDGVNPVADRPNRSWDDLGTNVQPSMAYLRTH